jgi:aromatic-L-amino-acid/L-tryptophan decarboxylase
MDNIRCDIPPEGFRESGYKFVEFISDYISNIESFRVTPEIKPGELFKKIDSSPPLNGEEMEKILDDVSKLIVPSLTHWNHPGFMAYFNSTSSGPGILGEFLAAAFNANGMLWKTSPASTELEVAMLGWLREFLGFPSDFWGIIYDTASTSTLHAIAAAREEAFPFIRERGLHSLNGDPLIFASEHAHSSVEKAVITLGLGLNSIRKVRCDSLYRMDPVLLDSLIKEERDKGNHPFCVVATAGTTSMTSIDPLDEIADVCKKYNIWLHVDAAHAGMAAALEEKRGLFKGIEKSDSIVVNPHKWMFVPVDLSAFYTRKPEILKRAFSVVREYLVTAHDNEVENQMDYGYQLGRRFRSLKLWFVFRYFGAEGIRGIIREHIKLGEEFAKWVDDNNDLERVAPVHFSTTCFRYAADKSNEELNNINKKFLERINSSGEIFISNTVIEGKFVLRLSISGIRTRKEHLDKGKEIIYKSLKEIKNEF